MKQKNKWLLKMGLEESNCARCMQIRSECKCKQDTIITNLNQILSSFLIGEEINIQCSFKDPASNMSMFVAQNIRITECDFSENSYEPDTKDIVGVIIGGRWDGIRCTAVINWDTEIAKICI